MFSESFGQLTRSEFLPGTLLQESPQFAQLHTCHFASLPSFSPSLTLFSFCAKDCRCFPVGHSGATHSLRALLSTQTSFRTDHSIPKHTLVLSISIINHSFCYTSVCKSFRQRQLNFSNGFIEWMKMLVRLSFSTVNEWSPQSRILSFLMKLC